jgi:hypothetical protein
VVKAGVRLVVKIFFLLIILSIPNQETVKYTGSIYASEELCIQARDGYMKAFRNKSYEYKLTMKTKAFCIPFESFPIKGISQIGA